MIRDGAPQGGYLEGLTGSRRLWLGRRAPTALNQGEDVLLCDAAVEAGAVDRRQVDVVFLGQAPYQR